MSNKKDCRLCSGTGVYNAPDGPDDYEPQICRCDEDLQTRPLEALQGLVDSTYHSTSKLSSESILGPSEGTFKPLECKVVGWNDDGREEKERSEESMRVENEERYYNADNF
jgi:hypothetical protein